MCNSCAIGRSLSLLTIILSDIFDIDLAIRAGGVLWAVSSFFLMVQLIKGVRILPPEMSETVSQDDFAAMFENLPPPPKTP